MLSTNLLNFHKPRTVTQWLIFLAATGIILSSPAGTRAFFRELNKYIFERNELEKKSKHPKTTQLSQTLYLLKKRKIINIKKSGNETVIELTEKGKNKKLQYDLNNLIIPKLEKWDEKWRFLMFDIPEFKKSARETLRKRLKKLGFFQFQKSVWIHPYECQNEISFLAEYLNISQYLTLITTSIEDDKPLKKLFQNTFKDCRSAKFEGGLI